MGLWKSIKDYYSNPINYIPGVNTAYNAYKLLNKGVPGGLSGKMRDEGDYAGVNQDNFNLPGFAERDSRLNNALRQIQGRGQFSVKESPFRDDQRQLADYLRGVMSGKDSMSQRQLQDATDRNVASQMSMAASARPGQGAMASRLAMQNAGRANQALAGQAAMAGIAERLGASSALGGMLGQMRGQDFQTGLANAQLGQQNRQANDEFYGKLSQQEMANAGLQQGGMMGYEQNRTNRAVGQLGVPANWEGLLGAASAAAPAAIAAMASDKRVKEKVQDGGKEADSFMDSINAMTYEYMDKAAKDGTLDPVGRTGSYTQDILNAEENNRRRLMLEAEMRLREKEKREAAAKREAEMRKYVESRGGIVVDNPAPPPQTLQMQRARPAPNPPPRRSGNYEIEVGPATIETPETPPYQRKTSGAILMAPEGRNLGVMAQDVERSPMGKQAVVEVDGVKAIGPAITGPVLASLARLHRRLKKIEGE
jgi:hypothetical protein